MNSNRSGFYPKSTLSELKERSQHHTSREFPLHGAPVTSQGLQNAVLLILALYGSLALVNWGSTVTNIEQSWRSVIDFLALSHLFG